MPLVGWRLIVWNGPVPDAAKQLIYKYISRNDSSHCVSRHPTDGGEHTHIIYYETSNSDSLRRRILRRFPGTELRSRQVRCFYCHRTYLFRGPEKWKRTTAVTTVPLGAKIVKISIKDAGAPKAKVDCNFVVKESNPILKAMKAQMKMFMESDAEKCFTEKENFDPESYTDESNKQSRKRPRSQYRN